jgi:hypothetical protein
LFRFEHWSAEDILNNYYYFGGNEEAADEVVDDPGVPSLSPPAEPSSRTRSSDPSGHFCSEDSSSISSLSAVTDLSRPKKAALVPMSHAPAGSELTAAESSSKSCKTYAQITGIDLKPDDAQTARANEPLCPFAFNNSDCPSRGTCRYLHGDFCDLCNRCCLHPFSEKQRRDHREVSASL